MLGIGKASAQRRLNMLASAFILFLQFTCLSLRSFLRHRVAPAVSSLNNGPLGSSKGRQFSDNVAKVSKSTAKLDAQQSVAAGNEFSNEQHAERWGVSDSEASKWRSEFQREGVIRLVQRGRRKVAVAPTQRVNGKLHVVS
jgi:hypothetical protein